LNTSIQSRVLKSFRNPRQHNFMPNLKKNPTLKDFQEYVKKLEAERGFSGENILQKCLLLGEEVGELNKAVRKNFKLLKTDNNSKAKEMGEELADIIIILCTIANRLDLDLEKAFREKEKINKKRKWD
jgi:NTP pyrophosphatase (non-canonical NTP hydrolase)